MGRPHLFRTHRSMPYPKSSLPRVSQLGLPGAQALEHPIGARCPILLFLSKETASHSFSSHCCELRRDTRVVTLLKVGPEGGVGIFRPARCLPKTNFPHWGRLARSRCPMAAPMRTLRRATPTASRQATLPWTELLGTGPALGHSMARQVGSKALVHIDAGSQMALWHTNVSHCFVTRG